MNQIMSKALRVGLLQKREHNLIQLARKLKSSPMRDIRSKYYNSQSVKPKSTTVASTNDVNHVPPLILRIGIITSAVGLATPIFATVGFLRFWMSYLPRTVTGYYLKNVVTVFGSGGTTFLMYNHVIPFFRDHSDFVLPFALSNGIAAGFWFLMGELAVGLPFMAGVASIEALSSTFPAFIMAFFVTPAGTSLLAGGLPIGGVVIGALTALTAPYLWPFAFSICWDDNTKAFILGGDSLWLVDLCQSFLMPITIPVGVISGLSMHLALKKSILGTPGIPWAKGTALPTLFGLCGTAFAYFYLLRPLPSDFMWEARMDHSTGETISYNPVTLIAKDDVSLSVNAESRRNFASGVHELRQTLGLDRQDKVSDAKTKASFPSNLDGPVTIKNINDRKDAFGIIDILVRLKHLRTEESSRLRNTEDIQKLKDLAATKVGIVDLDAFMHAVELAIIAKRRKAAGQDPVAAAPLPAVHDEKESCRLCDELKDSLITFSGKTQYGSSSGNAVKVLSENLSVLELELFNKLGYTVADTPEKELHMIKTYQNDRFYKSVILYCSVAALIAFAALSSVKHQ
jgi:hypothetical protein